MASHRCLFSLSHLDSHLKFQKSSIFVETPGLLRFDPAVLEPAADTVDLAGTVSEGDSATVNPNKPGLLKVVVFGPNALTGSVRFSMNLPVRFNTVQAEIGLQHYWW